MNTKAWMTAQFFQNFLVRFNHHVERNVLIFVDNASSRSTIGVNHANVEVINLPPNTTSKLQPLDAGVIAAFKRRIRKCQLAYTSFQTTDAVPILNCTLLSTWTLHGLFKERVD